MDDYDIAEIEHENIVLVVCSTFGNGDPPENGERFARELITMKLGHDREEIGSNERSRKDARAILRMNSAEPKPQTFERLCSVVSVASLASDVTNEDPPLPLSNVRFSVFALGSSAYPNFCAFGKFTDSLFGELGGERILALACGDELSGQEQAFKEWAVRVYQALSILCEKLMTFWREKKTKLFDDRETSFFNEFLNDQKECKVFYLRLATLNVSLTWKDIEWKEPIAFLPGDHVGLFAKNRKEVVEGIYRRLKNMPDRNQTIQVELLEEIPTIAGPKFVWNPHGKLPSATLDELFYSFLDITTPPTQQLLSVFSHRAEKEDEKKKLQMLATNTAEYDAWKYGKWPHMLEVFEEFPSVSIDAALLVSLLPLLQPRFYSVSSSLVYFPEEVHLTVGVLQFRSQG
ncbi:hypothetical protein QYM36_000584 [Artemia franciscana]|uniref:nitric-oxide synthase (NADPH) n=1 Tax=Artemia franciscana TaxID=6661 RepID=A0AA88IDK9_ARTSF|nr:hypothetical protein QYM36_000584 [Artemia franciscana]